jgi:hypothetical protein
MKPPVGEKPCLARACQALQNPALRSQSIQLTPVVLPCLACPALSGPYKALVTNLPVAASGCHGGRLDACLNHAQGAVSLFSMLVRNSSRPPEAAGQSLGTSCQQCGQMPTAPTVVPTKGGALDAWKAFRAAPLRTGICFSLCGNATTFALRLDGTLLSLVSIQSGSAMICRYFPQEPTRKITSAMTGGAEHDQGLPRHWRNYCTCHSRLLFSFSILNVCSPYRGSSSSNIRRTTLIAAFAITPCLLAIL